jgi:hypothetical protein
MLRRVPWLNAALWAGVSIAGAPAATPSPPTAADLQREAQLESSQVDRAVLARLERERAGDANGARTAARDAELHRERFLAITRDLERLLSPLPEVLSATAAGNPSMTTPVLTRRTAAITGRTGMDRLRSAQAPNRPWDMYRPHGLSSATDDRALGDVDESVSSMSPEAHVAQAGDLYATRHQIAPGAQSAAAGTPVAGASPPSARSPFLIYQTRLGSDARGEDQSR